MSSPNDNRDRSINMAIGKLLGVIDEEGREVLRTIKTQQPSAVWVLDEDGLPAALDFVNDLHALGTLVASFGVTVIHMEAPHPSESWWLAMTRSRCSGPKAITADAATPQRAACMAVLVAYGIEP